MMSFYEQIPKIKKQSPLLLCLCRYSPVSAPPLLLNEVGPPVSQRAAQVFLIGISFVVLR